MEQIALEQELQQGFASPSVLLHEIGNKYYEPRGCQVLLPVMVGRDYPLAISHLQGSQIISEKMAINLSFIPAALRVKLLLCQLI